MLHYDMIYLTCNLCVYMMFENYRDMMYNTYGIYINGIKTNIWKYMEIDMDAGREIRGWFRGW